MNILDKYLLKKKKYIVDYSKILSDFIYFEPVTLYKGKVELNQILNIIIDNYLDRYYCESDDSFVLLGDYFSFNIKENKLLNRIIYLVLEYYTNIVKKDVSGYKKDVFYLSYIISLGITINDKFNSVNENRKYKFEINNILNVIKEQKILKFKKNKVEKIKELISKIKTNNENEQKFFNYFDIPELYNKFKLLKTLKNTYFVRYEYNIETKKYKQEYVDKIFKKDKINELYLLLSYELLEITVLKDMCLKTNTKFIIPIVYHLYNNEQDIKKLNKIFNKKWIKEKVKFLIDEKIIKSDPISILRLKKNGYNVCVLSKIKENKIGEIEIIKENASLYFENTDYIKEYQLIDSLRRENN